MLLEEDRGLQRLQEVVRELCCFGRLRAAVERDDELVAADPADERRDLCKAAQAACDLGDDEVAGAVAVHVVHRLEQVEVDEHERDRLLLHVGALDHRFEPGHERVAIEEAGLRVVLREIANFLLGLPLRAQVADRVDALVLVVGKAARAHLDRNRFAMVEGAEQRIVVAVAAVSALQNGFLDRAAGDLFARRSDEIEEAVVRVDDLALGRDHDAFEGAVGEAAQALHRAVAALRVDERRAEAGRDDDEGDGCDGDRHGGIGDDRPVAGTGLGYDRDRGQGEEVECGERTAEQGAARELAGKLLCLSHGRKARGSQRRACRECGEQVVAVPVHDAGDAEVVQVGEVHGGDAEGEDDAGGHRRELAVEIGGGIDGRDRHQHGNDQRYQEADGPAAGGDARIVAEKGDAQGRPGAEACGDSRQDQPHGARFAARFDTARIKPDRGERGHQTDQQRYCHIVRVELPRKGRELVDHANCSRSNPVPYCQPSFNKALAADAARYGEKHVDS